MEYLGRCHPAAGHRRLQLQGPGPKSQKIQETGVNFKQQADGELEQMDSRIKHRAVVISEHVFKQGAMGYPRQ